MINSVKLRYPDMESSELSFSFYKVLQNGWLERLSNNHKTEALVDPSGWHEKTAIILDLKMKKHFEMI